MMRRIAFVFFVAICAAAPALASPPTIEQFIKIRWPVSGWQAPDGNFYYIHNPDGLNQVYMRPPGEGESVKLTDFPDGMSAFTPSEDGKWLVVAAGVGGNEQTGLYLVNTATRKMRALCCHPDIVYESVIWRRDSKVFAFRANDVVRSDFYVYLYDLKTNSTRRVSEEKGDNRPLDFSSDGKRLMVLKYTSASYSQLFEIDLTNLKRREVSPANEKWAFESVGYTADSKRFLAISNYKADKSHFVAINLANGAISQPFPQYEPFEADSGVLNVDRSVMAACLNEDGYRTLKLHSMADGKEIAGPKIDKGVIGNVEFCGDNLLFSQDNANTPGTIYCWSLKNPTKAPEALTKPDTQGIDVAKFPLPELIHYKSFDGLEIPAFLYLPADFHKGSKIPFVIEYHGGPEGQYRPSFNRIYQYLLSRGYGVLAPNVRGSSGYGMKYLEMDNYKKRMDSVRDGVAAAKWLVDQGYSTAKQIGAYGGSYGGFMVMATITEAPEMYGAACEVVGICNMQTFLERTKDYRRKLREAEYGPLSDPEFLKSISPIYKVDRIKAPLMIAHGENDPRVPVHEARQLFEKMKQLHKPVDILIFPDEGHGFRKEKNRIVFATRLVQFFDLYLRSGESRTQR